MNSLRNCDSQTSNRSRMASADVEAVDWVRLSRSAIAPSWLATSSGR
eukprot:CAMPEP_0175471906 /NCGR_PEP_ID=MMETSP0095-20121207/73598_1 /TAXON_ID=311494 /ORGANISM="Alexandrium monilatum, Strain CCMP3105" /LENGTH=46 /DNA_ID= /DNA_START= /DNA_END= /DNA_ORIENTATION=